MKRYKEGLVPRQIKKGFYKNIELGKNVILQRITISNQLREMIASHVGLAGTSDTNREAVNASINLLTYDNRNIGNGIYGLKASFEWNIAEVVWQIEQNLKEFKDMLNIVYASQDPSFVEMRRLAQEAYENGRMVDAADKFMELSHCCKNDFSVFLSLGIISLFHKKDKEGSLEYFNKAVETVESQSDFYTSYALLYKALVLRNLDRITEAEKFSKQAVDLSPDFAEALYQNAQYSALLKDSDTAVSLLKTIVRIDILYCLKITNEHDFDGLKPHIAKIIKEINTPLDEKIKNKLKKIDEKLHYLNVITDSMRKQDLDVSDNKNIKQLKKDKDELAKMVNLNSVLKTFVIDKCVSRLEKNLHYDKSQLLSNCKDAQSDVKSEMKEAAKALKNTKDTDVLSPFFLYLFLSQLYAIPVGIFLKLPPSRFIEKYNVLIGGAVGIPPGIFILEILAFVSCVLIVFVPLTKSRLKCKKIYANLLRRGKKLNKTIEMIETVLP